jgi:hypothetical protein
VEGSSFDQLASAVATEPFEPGLYGVKACSAPRTWMEFN